MSWLLVTWFLAFGWVPEQGNKVNGSLEELKYHRIATVIQLGLEANAFDRLSLYGTVDNYQYYDAEVFFDPYRIDYTIGAKLRINKAITFEAKHECDHPVKANTLTTYNGSETSFIVKIQGTTEF